MGTLSRKALAATVAATLATTAHGMSLNPGGTGQVLIYPYYTVNRGQQTLVTVVNTTRRAKAVKVRFLEGRNGRAVLDFNLYLSPFDVWIGAVFANAASGPAAVATADTSCTVPRLTTPASFRNVQYTGANQDWVTATTPPSLVPLLGSLERTREGHIELIEMGLLDFGSGPTQLAEEVTHINGVPADCQAVVTAWTSPTGGWVANSAANIELPTGGLYGAALIVDVANGTLQGYQADAIEGFYTNFAQPGYLHRSPGNSAPDLGDADNGAGSIDVRLFTGNGETVQRVPSRSRTFSRTQPYSFDAVSLLYMHDAIYNDYITEASIGAAAEWVVTFPTKSAYVGGSAAEARPPFTNSFLDNGSACEGFDLAVFDREEATIIGSVDFFPPPAGVGVALCAQANVLTFNQSPGSSGGASRVLGSTLLVNAQLPFSAGWAQVTFDDPLVGGAQNVLNNAINDPATGLSFRGLPATGFWAVNFSNATGQPGLLANYGGAVRHRTSRAFEPAP